MNKSKITRFLAEKMWVSVEITEVDGKVVWWGNKTGRVFLPMSGEHRFNPFLNINHTFLIVAWMTQQKGFSIFELNFDATWDCLFLHPEHTIGKAEALTPPEAIALAAVRALATKEELKEFRL